MNSLSFRLNDLGITSKLFERARLRIVLAISLSCVLIAGAMTSAVGTAPTGDSYIKFSKSNARTAPAALNGTTVSGDVYIFLADSTINSAMYFLDTGGKFTNDLSITSMTSYPQDFQYRNSDGTPKPYNTKLLKGGAHTLVVRTRDAITNKYTSHTSVFTVKNTVVTTTTTVKPTTTTTTAKPVTTTVAPTTTTAPQVFTPAFAGDVKPGNIRWGSSIGGNGDPVARHGVELANRMGIRRTFWDMNKLYGFDSKGKPQLVETAKADLAAGRLPWVSVKLNGSWKENADGKYDDEMSTLLAELAKLNGTVWFTVHHEPEGGASSGTVDDPGGAPEWIRMQENTSKLLKELRAQGKGKNIGFSSILMGWTFQLKADGKTSASNRNPLDWYEANIWDFAGIDAYADNEATTPLMDSNGLQIARKFYGDRGLKIAIGEWGVRNQSNAETDAGEIPTLAEQQNAANRMQNYYTDILASAKDGRGAQIIGASYFDSGLNSPKGTWELRYLQLDKFRELIPKATSLRANQN